MQLADRTLVFDNSTLGRSHRHLMTLEQGSIINLKRDLPEWTYQQYGREIKAYRRCLSR
ncbi:hypothetical protein [Pistricoccus aurantiacus]|uniref:hypothetical protein n=1 Tax=Pistricoccus aurantiacus TaxID=1883414 RepID=UPI00363DD644